MSGRAPVFRVEGAARLRATLKAAGVKLDDLKAAHAEVAKLVDRAARPNAPRSSGTLAGTERSSGTTTAAIVRAGSTAVPYGGPIHWGWPKRHIRAQPWIYDAAVATESAWVADYLRAIEAIVRTIEGAD